MSVANGLGVFLGFLCHPYTVTNSTYKISFMCHSVTMWYQYHFCNDDSEILVLPMFGL